MFHPFSKKYHLACVCLPDQSYMSRYFSSRRDTTHFLAFSPKITSSHAFVLPSDRETRPLASRVICFSTRSFAHAPVTYCVRKFRLTVDARNFPTKYTFCSQLASIPWHAQHRFFPLCSLLDSSAASVRSFLSFSKICISRNF